MLLPEKDQKVIKKNSRLQSLQHSSDPSGNHLTLLVSLQASTTPKVPVIFCMLPTHILLLPFL